MASKTYQGGCHCKANLYEIELSPSIEEKHTVIKCNCSICSTNGYLLAFAEPDKVKWSSGGLDTDKLTKYNFNKGVISHYFCPKCGTSVAVDGALVGVYKVGVNVSSVLNLWS
jgi:hypothetical protein